LALTEFVTDPVGPPPVWSLLFAHPARARTQTTAALATVSSERRDDKATS
jgi:hypothetical protein